MTEYVTRDDAWAEKVLKNFDRINKERKLRKQGYIEPTPDIGTASKNPDLEAVRVRILADKAGLPDPSYDYTQEG